MSFTKNSNIDICRNLKHNSILQEDALKEIFSLRILIKSGYKEKKQKEKPLTLSHILLENDQTYLKNLGRLLKHV